MSSDTVLAEWTILSPSVLDAANKFVIDMQNQPAKCKCRKRGKPTAAGLLGQVFLSKDDIVQLREHLRTLGLVCDSKGQDMIQVVCQHHGDLVHIPSGHAHQVINLRQCVKMAFDSYVLHNYVVSSLYLGAQINAVGDCMRVDKVLLNAIRALHNAAVL